MASAIFRARISVAARIIWGQYMQPTNCFSALVFPTIQLLPLYNIHYCHISQTASSHGTVNICGNKIPTRCNRGFYCRSYCLLNMFRASLCPSSGAQEYYTVVAACGIFVLWFFQVAGLVWSWGLCVRFAGCWFTWKNHSTKISHAATTV